MWPCSTASSLTLDRNCARRRSAHAEFQPDWIVGLGGGSSLDAAKAMWVLYERPDVDPENLDPIEKLGLRRKARFLAIPTTSGTGSEATWTIVVTNVAERRKLGLGSREVMPDVAILDPSFVMSMPPRVTADTGMDALTHAIEGFTCQWHNDFSDGLCLRARSWCSSTCRGRTGRQRSGSTHQGAPCGDYRRLGLAMERLRWRMDGPCSGERVPRSARARGEPVLALHHRVLCTGCTRRRGWAAGSTRYGDLARSWAYRARPRKKPLPAWQPPSGNYNWPWISRARSRLQYLASGPGSRIETADGSSMQ